MTLQITRLPRRPLARGSRWPARSPANECRLFMARFRAAGREAFRSSRNHRGRLPAGGLSRKGRGAGCRRSGPERSPLVCGQETIASLTQRWSATRHSDPASHAPDAASLRVGNGQTNSTSAVANRIGLARLPIRSERDSAGGRVALAAGHAPVVTFSTASWETELQGRGAGTLLPAPYPLCVT